ncbi:epoxide hydrolase [Moniliophthora roreri]|nr:epoxide hydrolase [Moniliophthora roreri]
MNPQDPSSFNHRTERLKTGRKYHFIDQKPQNYNSKRTPTLLCIHGFPDFWYGWRYQIGPWVQKGCRVVVPDMLGYGGTDKPVEPSEYTTKKLCNDLAALLDLLEIRKAVVLGHDWGAFTVGRFALWHPDRLLALVILSVAYTPPSPIYISVEEVAKRAPDLGYMIDTFARLVYQSPTAGMDLNLTNLSTSGPNPFRELEIPNGDLVLNEKELHVICNELSKGMNGPLNYYRTARFRHQEELAANLPSNLRPDLPVLFIWGTLDKTTTKMMICKAHEFIPRLQDVALEGRGHWLMVEAKDEITERVMGWLEGLMVEAKGKL